MDNVVCIGDRYIAGVSESFGARPHRHPVLELYASCGGEGHVMVGSSEVTGGVVLIGPGAEHAISDVGRRGVAVFVDPLLPFGYGLAQAHLKGRPCAVARMSPDQWGAPALLGQPTAEEVRASAELLLGAMGAREAVRPFSGEVLDTIDYLQRPDAEFRMGVLADRACLSKSRLAHLFSEQTGITLKEYLLYKRMEQACRVMSRGSSVTEVAAELGFSSPSHIATSSMRLTGMQLTRMLGL